MPEKHDCFLRLPGGCLLEKYAVEWAFNMMAYE